MNTRFARPRPHLQANPSTSQQEGIWLNFVFFQKSKVPKFFRIRKDHLQWLLIIVPATAFIFFMSTLLLLITKEGQQRQLGGSKATVDQHPSEDIVELKQVLSHTQQEMLAIQKKLTAPAAERPLDDLLLFKGSLGRQDLRGQTLLNIENLSAGIEREQFTIKFNITNPNADKDQRVSGHAFVLLKTQETLRFYPIEAWKGRLSPALTYSDGESFSAMRLRPFQMTFALGKQEKVESFKIIFFNRQGDLMAVQEHRPTAPRP